LEIEFFLRIQIFNQEMQKSLDFGPESIYSKNIMLVFFLNEVRFSNL